MQELRLVLIIVGALAIAALLLHGLWSSRKEKPAKFGEKPLGKLGEESSVDADGFDQDGVGSVRVVNSDSPNRDKAPRKEPELHFGDKLEADPLMAPARPVSQAEPELPAMSAEASVQAPESTPAPKVSDDSAQVSVTAETAPLQDVAPQPVPEAVQAPVQGAVDEATAALESAPPVQPEHVESQAAFVEVRESEEALSPTPVVEQTDPVSVAGDRDSGVAAEPVVEVPAGGADSVDTEAQAQNPEVAPEPATEVQETLPPDYLVLNVHARHGEIIRGSELFRCLESNGLYFGENSVYHRHADAAGTGPIIYSVTNMVSPGHFPESDDPAFETPGIAFYLMLPCPGRADNNFNQMLQTAQRVADQLGADILDHERALITPHRIEACRDKAKRYTQA
ncbi:cell division protein ZipA [Photobacterium atrarenae]|uniref:Cell division protein ZipA n=1 Tax=Photobacterium atrarenae TaxID=865757 RepID=A0ABY5GCZ4_9GAMM|nr:cell division protein ZipA [Photobacterium atrarenae]UTV27061.1 cell division protein ZipA [Photobacterium atrarenae]